MLNEKGQRELAYLVVINDIQPILGSDNCEAAIVNAWKVMVRKNTFKVGDLAIYFEIDSLLDCSKDIFSFMEKYHGKVKTQRYTFGGKGNFISQGLLMHPKDLGWTDGVYQDSATTYKFVVDKKGVTHSMTDESRFLTSVLDVKHADYSNIISRDKEKLPKMPKFFTNGIGKRLMRYKWSRKILVSIFGARVKRNVWPYWVSKTDEDRVQNIPDIIKEEDYWICTEKIDGTSSTYTVKRKLFGFDFYVCSRNVVFTNKEDASYYNSNVYWEIAEKYDIKKCLIDYLKTFPKADWVTLQGETYGKGIQKRQYSKDGIDFAGFNLIDSVNGRWNSVLAKTKMKEYGIPWVPILDERFKMPGTVDELLLMATGNSIIDGKPREGFVFRSPDGKKSFKAVSNQYLISHGE